MIDVSRSANYVGDCRVLMRDLPDACVQTCITSPPYWGLRDYGHAGQIGLEDTPEDFVTTMVDVFREVRRVLRDDGTLWLNLGDSYSHGGCGTRDPGRWPKQASNDHMPTHAKKNTGVKPKDLVGIPWMVAFALRADGWYLRSDIIWQKPNPMPESVLDRPTKAHEYIFLLSKSATYYYDADASREPVTGRAHSRGNGVNPKAAANAAGSKQNSSWSATVREVGRRAYRSGNKTRKERSENGGPSDTTSHQAFGVPWEDTNGLRNRRSVWTVPSQAYDGAHFATFPPKLIEPCVLSGSKVGDLVLDPFFGSGTTGEVAEKHGRRWIGFDLGYDELAKERTAQRSLMGLLGTPP